VSAGSRPWALPRWLRHCARSNESHQHHLDPPVATGECVVFPSLSPLTLLASQYQAQLTGERPLSSGLRAPHQFATVSMAASRAMRGPRDDTSCFAATVYNVVAVLQVRAASDQHAPRKVRDSLQEACLHHCPAALRDSGTRLVNSLTRSSHCRFDMRPTAWRINCCPTGHNMVQPALG
jgi:hypothetical protein